MGFASFCGPRPQPSRITSATGRGIYPFYRVIVRLSAGLTVFASVFIMFIVKKSLKLNFLKTFWDGYDEKFRNKIKWKQT